MPRNPRCVQPGLAYHVTQRGTNHAKVFFKPSDHRLYLSLLHENLADSQVRILAYCLMTNHVHLVAVPDREDSLAVLLRRAHGRYAQYLNTRRGRSGHLWQARYYSCPLSPRHQWSAIRYVEQNPCRALMSGAPEQYPWSSAASHLTGESDASGLLDLTFWRETGGVQAWREMHGETDSPGRLTLLRRCTYSGRPFGEAPFIEGLENQFGRVWRRWGYEKLDGVGLEAGNTQKVRKSRIRLSPS
ncbi:MAG TPA: transposase [Bryobacteraceae bacterium]|jgi:putative transposase|nr:transposase [Bryobacteraceae bacterium]